MSDGTVAAWVATILAGRGWTQERLAEEAGLSHKTVWRLADPDSRVRPSLRALRLLLLEHTGYGCMQLLPLGSQKRTVCSILNQRVLEGVC